MRFEGSNDSQVLELRRAGPLASNADGAGCDVRIHREIAHAGAGAGLDSILAPEPITLATVGVGFGVLAWRMRRRRLRRKKS
jgi:hypothetical protein